MANTAETYWAVDGVSLQTFAFNITSLGGDREKPPPVRSEDTVVPYMPGSIWSPGVPDTQILTLGMWVQGSDEDGNPPTEISVLRQYEENWRKIRKLLFTPRRQFLLTKQFWVLQEDLEAGGVVVDDLPSEGPYRLIQAQALGTFAGGLVTSKQSIAHGIFTVDIKLNDPYFYSDEITIPFSLATGGGNPGPTKTIQVLGDDRTTAINVEIEGPITAAKITNTTHDVWLRYNTAVADGVFAAVEVNEFQARHDTTGTTYKSAGYVQHDGDAFWLFLDPGENVLTLSSTGGTGTAELTYQPRWF